MEKKFICGNKYTISPTNTIALPVQVDGLPLEIVVEDTKLVLKSTFHISLVCINEIIRKNNIIDTNFKDLVVKDYCDFVAINDISLLSYKDEFRFMLEGDQKAVVAMCNVSNLDKFFEILNKKYNLSLGYPPTHVTLYTLPGKGGIFMTDSADLKNLTKVIQNPIGKKL